MRPVKRTNIYLTEEERQALRRLSERQGRSQSELIREAVDRYLEQARDEMRKQYLERGIGLWKERTDLPDFLALRRELDREEQVGRE
jgi:predicted DNA-binding protein